MVLHQHHAPCIFHPPTTTVAINGFDQIADMYLNGSYIKTKIVT